MSFFTSNCSLSIPYTNICVEKTIMVILIIALLFTGCSVIKSLSNRLEFLTHQLSSSKLLAPSPQTDPYHYPTDPKNIHINVNRNELPVDQVTEFDYNTLNDPLVEPRKRPPRHVFNNILYDPRFRFPTRGYSDSYSKQGYLIDNKLDNDNPSKILYLFGREKFPSSSSWDYYVIATLGGNQIKISLDDQRRELYGGELVFVPILNNKYSVVIDPNAELEYNPYTN